MNTSWLHSREFRPTLLSAGFLAVAAVTLSFMLYGPQYPPDDSASIWDQLIDLAAKASPFILLLAGFVIFAKPAPGYLLGLLGCLLALTWIARGELAQGAWNSWLLLNVPPLPVEGDSFPVHVWLRISSTAMLTFAAACCIFRLPPWRLRHSNWPVIAAGSVAIAAWFVHSALPYRVPFICRRGVSPEFRILHLEKRGLNYHETLLAAHRNGSVYLLRSDRRLFTFRWPLRVTHTPFSSDRLASFGPAAALRTLRTPPANRLTSWNAEGWYVVFGEGRPLAFTSENGRTPPGEVVQLFRDVERTPPAEGHWQAQQDICLGFCYDTMAALGLASPAQRTQFGGP